MGHRNFACASQMFDEGLNQNQSYLHHVPCMHLGRTSIPENVSLVFPMENETDSDLNFSSHSNPSLRLRNYPLFSPNQGPLGYRATSASGPYCPNLPNYAQYMPSSSDYSRVIPSMDAGRGPYKRKSPSGPVIYERGSNSYEYYGSGCSSDCYISSGFRSLEEPNSSSRHFTWDCTAVAPPNCNRGRGVAVVQEGYHRNVRSRFSGTFCHPENILAETYFSTNTRRYLQPREHPIDHLRNVDLVGLSSSTTIQEQGGLFPVSSGLHGGILPSENSGINHEHNHFMAERSIDNISAEIGGYQGPIPFSSRNPGVMWQNFHASAIRSIRGGRNDAQRYTTAGYGRLPLQPHSGYAMSSPEGGLQSRSETYVSSRYSRPARNGDNSVGRSLGRISFDRRSQSFSDERDTHDRLFPEGVVVLDRPAFYGSRNSFDQHRDMRLDIDNMSYEELLALGEQIGNVNTGLSEEFVSKSLTTKKYSTSDKSKSKMQEEETCIICQEEYMKEAEVGTLHCGHNYHAECIRKWLLLKNACPICKAPALPDCN